MRAYLAIVLAVMASVPSAFGEFFANSQRREIRESELGSAVRMIVGTRMVPVCSGFLVENTRGNIYVATARHCLGYEATESCRKGGFAFTEIVGFPVPFALHCKRVVAGTREDDLVLLEVKMTDPLDRPQDPTSALQHLAQYRLADYVPPAFAAIQMIGFPADSIQDSKPTVSENCQIQPKSAKDINGQTTLSLDKAGAADELQRLIGKHNCSVYGGNSGGPIVLENTRDVVGLPAGYYPDHLQTVNSDRAAGIELTKGFVDRNRAALVENGVVLSSQPPRLRLMKPAKR
jgi:hypothetical protein